MLSAFYFDLAFFVSSLFAYIARVMIKLALALKGIDYEPVMTYPNQTPEYLAISPTGKVPALQTEHGVLVETNVILEYLDEVAPEKPLYPTNPFERAQVKELVKLIELYIELPARRCHTEAFWGVPVDDLTKKEVKRALFNGAQALARAAEFSPYVAGDSLTAADIMLLYTMDLAVPVAKKLFDVDLYEHAPGSKALIAQLKEMPEVQQIEKDKRAAAPAFNAYLKKAFSGK